MSLLAWDDRRVDAESTNRVKGRKHSPAMKQFVAADLFELNGKSYLVTVDYFSDFFELDHLRSTSSVYVIKKLKGHFPRKKKWSQ